MVTTGNKSMAQVNVEACKLLCGYEICESEPKALQQFRFLRWSTILWGYPFALVDRHCSIISPTRSTSSSGVKVQRITFERAGPTCSNSPHKKKKIALLVFMGYGLACARGFISLVPAQPFLASQIKQGETHAQCRHVQLICGHQSIRLPP